MMDKKFNKNYAKINQEAKNNKEDMIAQGEKKVE